MSLSIEEIRKNYSQFPDYKIAQIAEQDSHSLPPEVVTILLEEVKKRGLNKNLNESVHIQQAPLSEEKFVELKQAVLYAPCPSCGSRKKPLMALKLVETIGLIFLAQHTTRFFIACPTCNKKEIKGPDDLKIIPGADYIVTPPETELNMDDIEFEVIEEADGNDTD